MNEIGTKAYDVIVIGAGHAGIEAASASARLGAKTALVTHSFETIGRLSCNPAVGGMGKGQVVCEIDALGGEMALLADQSGIQFKTLGRSKGPAMWSPRSQNDKDSYPSLAAAKLRSIDQLDLIEGSVDDIELEEGGISGVQITYGKGESTKSTRVSTRSVVLCAGTFLCGKIHTGEVNRDGGRIDEDSSLHLTGSLRSVGFETGRLKTGTPPRIARDSIDFSFTKEDHGDPHPRPFSFQTERVENQIACFTTQTNVETHREIEKGLDRSPMFSGRISGAGPRYCPSVEDKIWRFADKESHTLFLEPEGRSTDSIYVNGFSTSLPIDVQEKALRTVPGLQQARFLKPGYAVEYDYFPPHQLNSSLMSRKVAGLFMAGQINGTSGYEEAAAQGFMAGVNAARWVDGREGVLIDRGTGYIGVLLDDLSTLSTTEPYRLFTSRAEYRLTLRRDNADLRLYEVAEEIGLLTTDQTQTIKELRHEVERFTHLLRRENVSLESDNSVRDKAWVLLRRPRVSLRNLQFSDEFRDQVADSRLGTALFSPFHRDAQSSYNAFESRLVEQLEINARYEGYIARHLREIERFREEESRLIPDGIQYESITSISAEGREKLQKYRPRSLGHASRISGVSRSDLSVLMLYIR